MKDKRPGYFARTIRNAIQLVLSGRERNGKASAPTHQDNGSSNGNGHSGGASGVIDYPDYYPAAEVLEEAAHDARHGPLSQ